MVKLSNYVRKLTRLAFLSGFLGIILWLLSYSWILFRLIGRETDSVWSFVIAVEIGAMIAGLLSVILGVISRRSSAGAADLRRASQALMLGGAVWFCLIFFNLVGIYFF
jgi:hypothetical protein